jgi:hypothetical protein
LFGFIVLELNEIKVLFHSRSSKLLHALPSAHATGCLCFENDVTVRVTDTGARLTTTH